LVKSRDKKIQVVYFGGFEADYLMIRQAMLEEYKRLEKLRDEHLLLPVPVINPLEGYSLDNPADAARVSGDNHCLEKVEYGKSPTFYNRFLSNLF